MDLPISCGVVVVVDSQNIIPVPVGAAIAVGEVIIVLSSKPTGMAFFVPIQYFSEFDLTVCLRNVR